MPSVCQIRAAGPHASKEDSDSHIVTMYAGRNQSESNTRDGLINPEKATSPASLGEAWRKTVF